MVSGFGHVSHLGQHGSRRKFLKGKAEDCASQRAVCLIVFHFHSKCNRSGGEREVCLSNPSR